MTLVANVTDINDKIYDAARAAGRESADLAREMTAHYMTDTERLGLGRPDHEPLASEYVEPIIDLIGALVERGHAYAAGGDVYFRVRTLRRLRLAVAPRRRPDGQGEGVEGAELKEDPLDFALWKAHKEGEDTWWTRRGAAGGPAGTSSARRWPRRCWARVRHPRRRHRPGLPAPRERDRPDAGRARQAARADLDAQRDARAPGEKMSKSVGNIRGLGEVLDEVGGETLVLYFSSGHYRQPLPSRPSAGGGGQRRAADPGGGAPADPGRIAGRARCAPRRVLRRPGRGLQHGAGAAGAVRVDRRGEHAPRAGDAHLREMLGVLGLGAAVRRRGPAGRGRGAGRAARRRPGGEGLGRGRPAARRAARAWAGRCATARRTELVRRHERRGRRPPKRDDRGGPKRDDRGGPNRHGRAEPTRPPRIVPARRGPTRGARPRRACAPRRLRPVTIGPRARIAPHMVVYGRNAVREALRGRGRSTDLGDQGRGRRGVAGAPVADRDCRRDRRRCGSDAHQGVCADVEEYRYADAGELLRGPTRCSSPSTRSPTRRTSAPGEDRRVRRRHRDRDPRAALGRGDGRGLQGVGGGGGAPTGGPGPQPGRLPRRREGGGLLDLRRGGRRGDAVPRARLLRRRRAGARGGGPGPRPRVAAACDDLVALPLQAASSRST